MWRWTKRIARWCLLDVGAGLVLLAVANGLEAQRYSRPVAAPTLTAAQKAQVTGALRLQQELGDRLWPGLAGSGVPVILFNDRYEFLVGLQSPPAPWEPVGRRRHDQRTPLPAA